MSLTLKGATLNDFDKPAIKHLFTMAIKTQALLIFADRMKASIFDTIFSVCTELQHFQYIGADTDHRGCFRYMIMNLPSGQLDIGYATAFSITVPVEIRKIHVTVSGTDELERMGRAIAGWEQQGDFRVEKVAVDILPGHSLDAIYRFLSVFLIDCMPEWSTLSVIQSISLTTDGFEVEIPRPDVNKARNLIRVSLHDASYIAAKLTPITDFEFVVIVSDKFPHYIGDEFKPSKTAPEHIRELYGDNEYSALSSIETIHELRFLGYHIAKFFRIFPELVTVPHSFVGLVQITAMADIVVDKRVIPFDRLRELNSFKRVYLQAANTAAFEMVNAFKYRTKYGAHEPTDADGICWYRTAVQEG